MFRYDDTGKVSKSGEKQQKLVTKTRKKTYENMVFDRKGKVVYDKKTKKPLVKISYGTEIVKEIVADPNGPNKDLL